MSKSTFLLNRIQFLLCYILSIYFYEEQVELVGLNELDTKELALGHQIGDCGVMV